MNKSVKSLINKVARHRPKSFIAPVMTKYAKLFVVQNGIPYWFVTEVEYAGWYYLNPTKVRSKQGFARPIRNASPHEYIGYMSMLPQMYVIALFPIDDLTWLVMPYNISDAKQRGWKSGEPRFMYLTLDNISSLDIVKTRMLSDTLIFDHLSNIVTENTKEITIARNIIDNRLQTIKEQEARRARRSKIKTEREKIEESLAFMGAELKDWTRNINGYVVRWKIDGQVYRMEINTNLRIESAGVCLNGTDDWHSLSSVVGVMQERARAIDAGEHGDY